MSSSGRLVEERKIGILMIEPDMRLVLDCGKPLMVGSTDEVRSSEVVWDAYLGKAEVG